MTEVRINQYSLLPEETLSFYTKLENIINQSSNLYNIYDIFAGLEMCAHCNSKLNNNTNNCYLSFPHKNSTELYICKTCVEEIDKKLVPKKYSKKKKLKKRKIIKKK